MKQIQLSNEEINIIIEIIDNQFDIIYDRFTNLSDFLQKRADILNLIRNKLEQQLD